MIDEVLIAYDNLPINANEYKGIILFDTKTGLASIYQNNKLIFSIYIDELKNKDESDEPEKPITYNIIFKNGEEIIKTVTGVTGTPVEIPDVSKEGYTFNGWSIDGKNPIFPINTIDENNITYFALWEEIQQEEPEEQKDTPEVNDPTNFDLGILQYKIGLISDIHFNTNDSKLNSEYTNNLINALKFFVKQNVTFITCTGDIAEYSDEDFIQFKDIYNYYGYTKNHKRLFCAMGNYDYYRCFQKRNDNDVYTDNTLYPYIPLWGNISKFKSIPNKGGSEAEKDLTFFEFDSWDYAKHDFKEQNKAHRTSKSKLSYYLETDNNIFVFLSVDLGIWNYANNPTYAMTKGFNILNIQNKYVQEMKNYVLDTKYNESLDGKFDYQFYNPDTLMWLKHICDKNKDKRIFVFTHYFLPNKVGDGNNISYSKLKIWPEPTNDEIRNYPHSGSDTLCGLEFYFINKLNNENKNLIWISGHSNFSWIDSSTCYYDYDFKQPNGKEITPLVISDIEELNNGIYDYQLYTRIDNIPKDICGLNIHLPSLTKPINEEGKVMEHSSEGGILEIYENGIVLKEIIFKEKNNSDYVNKIYKTETFKI